MIDPRLAAAESRGRVGSTHVQRSDGLVLILLTFTLGCGEGGSNGLTKVSGPTMGTLQIYRFQTE